MFKNKNILKIVAINSLFFFSNLLMAQQVSTVAGNGTMGYADGTGNAMFRYPAGVVSDGAGHLYVADITSHCIRKIRLSDGMVSTFAGSTSNGHLDAVGTAAKFNEPSGLAIDRAAGFLYVSETYNHCIRKISLADAAVTTLAGSTSGTWYGYGYKDAIGTSARFKTPNGLALDGIGNLYVADAGNHRVRKIDVATGNVTTVVGGKYSGNSDGVGTDARFNNPIGLVYDGNGNLYLSDYSNHRICKINIATSTVTTVAGALDGTSGYADAIGTNARFKNPYGLAINASGNLFIADYNNTKIRKVKLTTGQVTTVAGSNHGLENGTIGAALFSYPVGIAFDEVGNLFIGDSYNYVVRKIAVTALPVKWGNIQAVNHHGLLSVTFQSYADKNVHHFEIEASVDGNDFKKIGVVFFNENEHGVYTFKKDFLEIIGALFIPFGLLIISKKQKVKQIVLSKVIPLICLVCVLTGCIKTDSNIKTERLFVRIVQVDKIGNKNISKVIIVSQ